MTGWLSVIEAAKYARVSPRTFRMWMSECGIEFSRVRGRVLIKPDNLDRFLESHSEKHRLDEKVNKIIDEVLTEI